MSSARQALNSFQVDALFEHNRVTAGDTDPDQWSKLKTHQIFNIREVVFITTVLGKNGTFVHNAERIEFGERALRRFQRPAMPQRSPLARRKRHQTFLPVSQLGLSKVAAGMMHCRPRLQGSL
jgi:hypothetical protein